MSDVKCPYCGTEQEINHDDGYGYEEDETHVQECVSCDHNFSFSTTLSYDYEVYCIHGEHYMEQSPVEGCSRLWECSKCDHYEVRD